MPFLLCPSLAASLANTVWWLSVTVPVVVFECPNMYRLIGYVVTELPLYILSQQSNASQFLLPPAHPCWLS